MSGTGRAIAFAAHLYLIYDRIRAGGSLVPGPPALMYRGPSLTNVYVRPYYGMHDHLGLALE